MKRLILLILLLGSIPCVDLFAEVSVFLIPIIQQRDDLTLRDIARIDCSSPLREKLYGIQVHAELYRDGFIDRREIYSLTKNYADDVIVYGNAVKISTDSSEGRTAHSNERGYSVESGTDVYVIIKKKGITVEIRGTALEDGERGDEIMVMIMGSKKLRGRIAGRKRVEVIL